jgi:hypothetical protein
MNAEYWLINCNTTDIVNCGWGSRSCIIAGVRFSSSLEPMPRPKEHSNREGKVAVG